jgi:predicted DNA-binding transcriptional regulator AlpA
MLPTKGSTEKVDTSADIAPHSANLSYYQLINAEQLMILLPASRMTIWRLEKQGKLPMHSRIGGRNYWRLSAILASLEKLTGIAASS